MESAGYISRCVFVAQTSNIAVTQDNSKSSRLKCTKLLQVVWWGDGEWNEHNELKNQDEKINDSNFYVISISWAGVWAAYNLFQIDLNGWTFDCKIASDSSSMLVQAEPRCEWAGVCRSGKVLESSKLHYFILFIQWQIRFATCKLGLNRDTRTVRATSPLADGHISVSCIYYLL